MKILGLIHYYLKYLAYLIFGRDGIEKLRKWERGYSIGYCKNDLSFFNTDTGQLCLHNNKWGEYKLGGGRKYWQKTFSTDKGFIGWSFSPPLNQKGVLGYPCIINGGSGWGMVTISGLFPVFPISLKKLQVYYDILLRTDKLKHNLTFDLWICDKTNGMRMCEIMIWEDYQVARPFGKKKGETGDYIITSGYLDKSDEPNDEIGWEFVGFRRKSSKRRTSGTVDILHLLKEAVRVGAIPEEFLEHKLMGVELGTEVYSSVGFCLVRDFDINYEEI